MGNKQAGTSLTETSAQNPFKLFEYQCPNCNSKRPIQYFYRNGVFLPQAPRVVCGCCNTSVTVEPFKTVDWMCPMCKKWHKARLPARPMPINTYNMSRASCGCGFHGEVPVGRLMDVSCSQCLEKKRELRSVWTEDGDEVKCYCERCKGYQRSFATSTGKKAAAEPDMEYSCENCFRCRPINAEELLRHQGLAFCSLCGWVGYPEVFPRGTISKSGSSRDRGRDRDRGKEKAKKHSDKSMKQSRKAKSRSDDLHFQSALPSIENPISPV